LRPGSNFCPLCGISLKKGSSSGLIKTQKILMILSWIDLIVAWLLIIPTAETVVVTGPILFILGLAIIVIGISLKHPISAFMGGAHCLICILFVTLVNVFNWSPSFAHDPFLLMSGVYILGMGYPGALAFRLPSPIRSPYECQKCGYLLYGLIEPRCPECGTGFDPSLMGEMTPPGMKGAAGQGNSV
jgi:hypothetical protein